MHGGGETNAPTGSVIVAAEGALPGTEAGDLDVSRAAAKSTLLGTGIAYVAHKCYAPQFYCKKRDL